VGDELPAAGIGLPGTSLTARIIECTGARAAVSGYSSRGLHCGNKQAWLFVEGDEHDKRIALILESCARRSITAHREFYRRSPPMPVTIEINDTLAAQLQQNAAAQRISLAEFAQHLLDGALGQIEATDRWTAKNRRRLDLIHQSCTTKLSVQEQQELQELQSALDQRLEPVDDHLLDALRHWQTAADTLPGNRTA
jgi:hypothetical protein